MGCDVEDGIVDGFYSELAGVLKGCCQFLIWEQPEALLAVHEGEPADEVWKLFTNCTY